MQKKMKLPYLVNLEKHSIVLCHVESMRMQRDYFKTSRDFISLESLLKGLGAQVVFSSIILVRYWDPGRRRTNPRGHLIKGSQLMRPS